MMIKKISDILLCLLISLICFYVGLKIINDNAYIKYGLFFTGIILIIASLKLTFIGGEAHLFFQNSKSINASTNKYEKSEFIKLSIYVFVNVALAFINTKVTNNILLIYENLNSEVPYINRFVLQASTYFFVFLIIIAFIYLVCVSQEIKQKFIISINFFSKIMIYLSLLFIAYLLMIIILFYLIL